MARFNAGPSALTAAAAAAAAVFFLCCSSIGGVHAYAAKGLGGIASSGATHPSSSSALVPSSALARGGRYPGDYDDLPYGPPYLNDMDDYGPGPGPGPYGYGAFRFCQWRVSLRALCVPGTIVCARRFDVAENATVKIGNEPKHQRLGVHAPWGEAPKARNSSIHTFIYNTCSECGLWLTKRNSASHGIGTIVSFPFSLASLRFCSVCLVFRLCQ